MNMDMVRPWKAPWGLSPSLRPWQAWTVLTDLCARSRPIGPRRLSCVACTGRVCYCHCGGDGCSQHLVRLVCVNGCSGCRTTAAGTLDLILHTLLVFTSIYRLTNAPPQKIPKMDISIGLRTYNDTNQGNGVQN